MKKFFQRVVCALLLSAGPGFSLEPAYEQSPIFYSDTEPDTPLTRIRDRIEKGEELLTGSTRQEVLLELLELLGVPVESQVLVYSKTSAQNSRISPQTPRAIYFSDNAYVGWVQHGNIEVITFDEKLGMVFHMIDISDLDRGRGPRFNRDRSCLNCHGGSATGNWPGIMVRSVYPEKSGQPIFHAGTFRTDHSSPIEQRWGGWYVTGDPGEQEHLGNIIAREDESSRKVSYQAVSLSALKSLEGQFPAEPYPGGAVSDIVALMILEHQLVVHNALVQGNLVTRQTFYRHRKMKEAFGEPVDSPLSDTNRRVLDSQAGRIVRALFFSDEHIMEGKGVEGSIAFQKAFGTTAKKNTEHRSLRDLRLYERLFKYRCSYLVYCDAFNQLPGELKSLVIAKMKGVLSGKTGGEEFEHLGASERERISGILEETFPEWNQ